MLKNTYTKFREIPIYSVYANRVIQDQVVDLREGYGGMIDAVNSGDWVYRYGYRTRVQTHRLLNSDDYTYIEVGAITHKPVGDNDPQITVDLSLDDGTSWIEGYSQPGIIQKPSESSILGYSWVTTTAITQARTQHSSFGTSSESLVFGGTTSVSSTTALTSCYLFDNNVWATTSALPAGVYLNASCGDITAGISFGGNNSGGSSSLSTNIWDGSVWSTTSAVLSHAKAYLGGCGTAVAALAFGSNNAWASMTEIWDGSIWATTSSMNYSLMLGCVGCGTVSSAIADVGMQSVGGEYPIMCETWNGTIWSTRSGPTIHADIRQGVPTMVGSSADDALSYAEEDCSILYNNIWATTTSLVKWRQRLSGSGTSSSALAISGFGNEAAVVNNVEKWVRQSLYTKLRFNIPENYDTFVWQTTSNMNRRVRGNTCFGDHQHGLSVGGSPENTTVSVVNYVEGFDGCVWSTTTSANYNRYNCAGIGSERSGGLVAGGHGSTISSTAYTHLTACEKWTEHDRMVDGIWAVTGALTIRRFQPAGCGSVSSALCFGGYTTTDVPTARTDKWNGSAWSTTSNMSIAFGDLAGCGNTSAAIAFGGSTKATRFEVGTGYNAYLVVYPEHKINHCLKWSGSSWSTTSSLLYVTDNHTGFGDATTALCIGSTELDESTLSFTTCQLWNNSIWTTTTALPAFLAEPGSFGSASSSGFHCAGDRPLVNGSYPYITTNSTYQWLKSGMFNGFIAYFR